MSYYAIICLKYYEILVNVYSKTEFKGCPLDYDFNSAEHLAWHLEWWLRLSFLLGTIFLEVAR